MNEYISREDVQGQIIKAAEKCQIKLFDKSVNVILQILQNMAAADVQPVKRGNWVQIGEQSAKCTECGGVLKSNGIDKTGKALIFNAVYHYCPYCGARMIKEKETE